MKATLRAYDAANDYMRIRDFIVETYGLYGRPFNWLIDRWNFCRYFVVPVHSYHNVTYFGVPAEPRITLRDELPYWESTIGVWENAEGDIVGVVHSENEEAGEAWIQIHPKYHGLYDEMVTYAEEHLADRVDGTGYLKLYVNDGTALEGIVEARGYRRLPFQHTILEHRIENPAAPELPEGYVVRSVAEEDDVDKRRKAKSLAFGAHYNPRDWGPAEAYREMQRAPDYRPELDLFIVAPDGEYVSFTTIWVDRVNRYAVFEPVGTHAEYQGKGLGRAMLQEGFRRMADCGAPRSYMDSGIEFYRKVGFQPTPHTYHPWIRYFTA